MNTLNGFKRFCRLFKDLVKRKKAKKNALTRHQNVLESMWYHMKVHIKNVLWRQFTWYHISNNATRNLWRYDHV